MQSSPQTAIAMRICHVASLILTLLLAPGLRTQREPPGPTGEPPWQAFVIGGGSDQRAAREALEMIGSNWRDGYAPMILDVARLLPSPRAAGRSADEQLVPDVDDGVGAEAGSLAKRDEFPSVARRVPGAEQRRRLTDFLERHTGQRFGDDLRAWRKWIWSRTEPPHPDYALFKAEVYARIDPVLRTFFPAGVKSAIRLDEIDWGGVRVNGIPSIRSPKVVLAGEAGWLRDGHVVFGLEVNGEARAYPKRILAWHEMAIDRLGGLDLTIVYCTLCGTVIPYESHIGDRQFAFGTSGLLYRSNKLMFDEETRSLWSSLEGLPVVGPLVGSGLQLSFQSAVTTTWGEWRREHPATTVLSLETGFKRDYSEGAAYREYFASDRLMFEVPATDARLKNKAEVLVFRPELVGRGAAPVAISVDLLKRQPLFTFEAGQRRFVVVTSKDGANRMYDLGEVTFTSRDRDGHLLDAAGRRWRVTPEALVGDEGARRPRVAAHRAFWFGWYAQHPDTVLYR
jgi:Protein of unknown function (DUF3179)